MMNNAEWLISVFDNFFCIDRVTIQIMKSHPVTF